jgi:hypothetical protein
VRQLPHSLYAPPGHRHPEQQQQPLEGNCQVTSHWEVFPGVTNIYNREPSPTNITHGTLHFIGLFDTADECFAAVNASSKDGPFHSFTYNDPTVKAPYGRHCWADSSMVWQNRGGAKGQVSGRGPGFPLVPKPLSTFTHDHLTGLREVHPPPPPRPYSLNLESDRERERDRHAAWAETRLPAEIRPSRASSRASSRPEIEAWMRRSRSLRRWPTTLSSRRSCRECTPAQNLAIAPTRRPLSAPPPTLSSHRRQLHGQRRDMWSPNG